MHPILLKLGPITVFSYGAFVAVGFGVATLMMRRTAPRFGVPKEQVVDLAIAILIGGIIGARALYIALNHAYYAAHPFEIVDLSKGGLVWYGSFIGGLIASWAYIARARIDFWNMADLVIPYVALAQAFGRIGCFMNGCCYGTVVPGAFPLGVAFPGSVVHRHPTQLYSAAALALIFLVLAALGEHRRFRGEVFVVYCIIYSMKRFGVEFLRGDSARIFIGLTMSQLISVIVFAAAIAILFRKGHAWKQGASSSR